MPSPMRRDLPAAEDSAVATAVTTATAVASPASPLPLNSASPAELGFETTPDGRVSTRQFLELFSAVMVPMFLAVADQTLLATATPRIASELGGLRDTSWIALGYLMAATIMVPLYGRLGDRFGRRSVLLSALGIFAAGSAGCGLAASLGQLIGARVLQGLGGGGLMVMAQALIGELVPPRERGRFQGYFAMNFTVASLSGPLIGGLVVEHGNWRWLFLANLPLVALAAWRVSKLPPGTRSATAALEDVPGVLLFTLASGLLLVWLTFGGHRFEWASATSVGLGAATIAFAAILIARERSLAAPFLPVELLRERSIALMCTTVALFAACLFAVVFFLPIYLQLGLGAKAAVSGVLLLPLTLGMVVGSTSTGRFIARTGWSTRLPPFGLALAAMALLLLAVLPEHQILVGGLCLLVGLGFGTVMPSSQVTIQTLAGRERLGAAAAVISLARAFGGALGTAVFGAVAFGLMPHANGGQVPTDVAGVSSAFRAMFGTVAIAAALAAVAATRIPRLKI
jgi:EmrB/QacA subfamily drug resistance transporter